MRGGASEGKYDRGKVRVRKVRVGLCMTHFPRELEDRFHNLLLVDYSTVYLNYEYKDAVNYSRW